MSARHPDELVFGLLKDGFTAECFDGQPFFDPDHPIELHEGTTVSVSNMQDGAGRAWFLSRTRRARSSR
jgi:phage major head subunit gpT-like protein